MQTRHRVPTVFTLYMVDVLCCALGCVILLWFLKLHEAEGLAETYRTTGERLRATEVDRDETRSARDTALAQAAVNARDRDSARTRLAALEAELERLKLDRDRVVVRAETAEKDRDGVRRERDSARNRIANLDKMVAS